MHVLNYKTLALAEEKEKERFLVSNLQPEFPFAAEQACHKTGKS